MSVLVPSKFEEDLIENEHHFFSTTQGHVTPKWFIRSGRNSNLSEILCLFSLPVSLMEIEFRVIEKRWIHHFLHYKSMGKKIQRSRANNSKVNNLIRPKFELILAFMPVLVTCKFDKYLIKGDWEKLEPSFSFTTQGHVTPQWLVRSSRISNPSKILCLLVTCKVDEYWIHSNWEKVETSFSMVTEKRWMHHFLHYKSMLKGEKLQSE